MPTQQALSDINLNPSELIASSFERKLFSSKSTLGKTLSTHVARSRAPPKLESTIPFRLPHATVTFFALCCYSALQAHLSKQCTLGAQSRYWYWLDLETMGIVNIFFDENSTGPLEVIQLRVV